MPADPLPSEWVPLASRNVRAARYDADTLTLGVMFNSGSEYEYYDVPQEVADEFMNSSSPGSEVRSLLGGYAYARID